MSYCRLAISALLLLIGCDSATDHKVDIPETQKEIVISGISYTLRIAKAELLVTDSLSLYFIVSNKSDSIKTFWFANQQQFGFELLDSKDSLITSFPRIVQPAPSTLTITPSTVKEYKTTAPLKNIFGNYFEKGNYLLSAFLLNDNSPKVSLHVSIK